MSTTYTNKKNTEMLNNRRKKVNKNSEEMIKIKRKMSKVRNGEINKPVKN